MMNYTYLAKMVKTFAYVFSMKIKYIGDINIINITYHRKEVNVCTTMCTLHLSLCM